MIRLIVGLGNPGKDYALTRHNAGFWFVDQVAQQLGAKFSVEGRFFAEVAKVKLNGVEVYLLKPQTYMNLSGKAVQALASFYKISNENILVVHDELDFKVGVAKLKLAGGSGGHNGLKDIDRVLGRNYWRLRIGIGHPNDAYKVVNYVLAKPELTEQIAINLSIDKALAVCNLVVNGDFANAQKQLHSN